MPRSKVELRICYGSVGAFEAERYALALVHWDRRELRVGVRRPLPETFGAARAPLDLMLHGLEERASRVRPGEIDALSQLVPARAGDAGVVSWAEVRVGYASDPERHFRELAKSLGLQARAPRTGDERFLAWVEALGDPGGTMLAAGHTRPAAREGTMTFPGFKSYDAREAAECGDALLSAFRSANVVDANDTAQWTETILDWFAETAPVDGVVVDAHASKRLRDGAYDAAFHPGLKSVVPRGSKRRSGTKECLVDLSHYRFRSYEQYGQSDYWKQAFDEKQEPEALLVLESEWGRAARPPGQCSAANVSRVLEDASKLFAIAARVKVVVFASNSPDERRAILQVADRMSARDYTKSRVGTPVWLWIDLPWCAWTDAHGPSAWVITEGTRVPVT